MDTQQEKPEIDPLRRVFVPIEKRTQNGTIVFRTTDKMLYARTEEGGPIYRAVPKARGKQARAEDKRRRRELRRIQERKLNMKPGDDPREPKGDAQKDNPEPPSNSNPRPAPGGVGTDTKNDPANKPDAQPKDGRDR